MRPNQKAALKHAMHKPRQLPQFLRESPTTKERLATVGGIFALGVFFGWLLAGCPNIAALFSHVCGAL